jgi:hypothetical protein
MREIMDLAGRANVHSIAVQNFLGSLEGDSHNAWENLRADRTAYKWNDDTVQAVADGIELACKEPQIRAIAS